MRPDFALEDPSTFSAVLPWSHFSSGGGRGSRDVSSSKLLQEKVRLRACACVPVPVLAAAANASAGVPR